MLVQEVAQDLASSTTLGSFPANDHVILSTVQEGEIVRSRGSSCGKEDKMLPGLAGLASEDFSRRCKMS